MCVGVCVVESERRMDRDGASERDEREKERQRDGVGESGRGMKGGGETEWRCMLKAVYPSRYKTTT